MQNVSGQIGSRTETPNEPIEFVSEGVPFAWSSRVDRQLFMGRAGAFGYSRIPLSVVLQIKGLIKSSCSEFVEESTGQRKGMESLLLLVEAYAVVEVSDYS